MKVDRRPDDLAVRRNFFPPGPKILSPENANSTACGTVGKLNLCL